MIKSGEMHCSDEYRIAVEEIEAMDIPESEKRRLLTDPICERQCADCIAAVEKRRAENKAKYGW